MTVGWTTCRATEVPSDDGWLTPSERAVQAGLAIAKRRLDWRLGRFAAKQLLAAEGVVARPEDASIVAAEDGAPEIFVDGARIARTLSISHRGGVGAAALSEHPVGCDLEVVEPRSATFVEDFFTDAERARMTGALSIVLCWSAKESVLKAVRTGLRRDTRTVEVTRIDLEDGGRIEATDLTNDRRYAGWWRRIRDDLVLTLMA